MMNKAGAVHHHSCKWIVIVLLMIVAFYFCFAKTGYFIDEVYSYGLSNSKYAPFIKNVMQGDITGKIISHKDLFGYVAAGENRFNYASVYYNQTQDVHPPLYYCILHTACSIFPDCFSKWLGLIPNLLFYTMTLLVLSKISDELFGHATGISLSVIILYGLSAAGLSTVLFVRMYMLMTLLTVLLSYLILRLMRYKEIWLYPATSVVIYMGLLTHYYFVFYAFFVCLFYIAFLWKEKHYRYMWIFMIFALLGVGGMYLTFPDCVIHITKGTGNGETAMQHLMALDEYISRVYSLFKQVVMGLFIAVAFGGGVFATLLLNHRKVKEQLKRTGNAGGVVTIIPAFLAALVIICISAANIRYIYNLLPFYVLLVGYLMFILKGIDMTGWVKIKKRVSKYFIPVLFCTSLFMTAILKPDFLYKEHKQYNQLIKPYTNCVYISDNINPCITSDLCQLLNFNEICVSNVSNISNGYKDICSYVEFFDDVVVYIAKYKNPYSGDEITDILWEHMQECDIEELYEGDFSAVYLLKRERANVL